MIDRAVYSYWNIDGQLNTSGFSTFRDFLATISLSVLTSREHFKEIGFVTNGFGKKVFIDLLNLPFDDVSLTLDENSKVKRIWWAYSKLCAYAEQDKPFVHIDNDAFLWDGLPRDLKNGKLCFQSLETPFKEEYGWYVHLLKAAERCGYFPKLVKDNPVDFAFNCGICDLGWV